MEWITQSLQNKETGGAGLGDGNNTETSSSSLPCLNNMITKFGFVIENEYQRICDKKWIFFDKKGHKHRWYNGKVTCSEWVLQGVRYEGDAIYDCRCKKCGEEIFPGFKMESTVSGWFYVKRDLRFLMKKTINLGTWIKGVQGRAKITKIEKILGHYSYKVEFTCKELLD